MAVRELITKIKFQIDRASQSQVNTAIQRLKSKLQGLSGKNNKIKVNADTSAAQSSLSRIKTQLNSLQGKTVTTYVNVRQKGNIRPTSSKNDRQSGYSDMGRELTGLAGIAGSTLAVDNIRKTADEMMNLDGRLRIVTKDEQERLEVERELYALGQKTRQPMKNLGDLYFRVARASEELGFAQQDNLRVTETVSKALIVGQASRQEASSTILQLGQALGSGRLQGDELRSLDENASNLMKHVAEYFGTNVAGLKEMGREGKLTSDELMKAILASSAAIDKEFINMPMTFGQAMNVIGNSWDSFVLSLEQKSTVFSTLAQAMVEVFEELGTELKNLSQSDLLKDMISMFDALDGKQGNLKDQLKGIISVLVKVGMVIVPIITALAALGGAMLLLEPIFSLLGSLAGVFVSILSVGLGPILGILAAIAAVIYTIYENWDLVVSWFEPAIDLMMSGLDQLAQAWESLQPFIEAIMPLLEFVAQLIGGAIVVALSLLVRMWATGFNTIASFINMVCGLLGTLGEIIKTIAGGLSGIIDQALEFLGLSGNISGVNMSAMNSLVPAPSFSYGGNNTQNNTYNFSSPTQLYPAQKSNNLFFQRND